MDTIFCHVSAYEALNALRAAASQPAPADPSERLQPVCLRPLPATSVATGSPSDAALESASAAFGVRAPAHVLVGRKAVRHTTSRRVPHVASDPLAARSLVRIGPEVASVSPEHLFLQMARTLPRVGDGRKSQRQSVLT